MKAIAVNHIDYWQHSEPSKRGLKNRCGVRIRDGRCWALFQLGPDEPFTFGKPYDIPVDLSNLPSYVRFFVDNELLNYPSSDLLEVLTGTKSFHAALDSPAKIGPQRMTTVIRVPFSMAS